MNHSHTLAAGPALRGLIASALVAVAVLAAFPGSASAQPVNLTCLGGEGLSDGDLARGTTIVVVWASWSPRSRGVVESVSSLASRWGGRARVVTVTYQEDRQAVERFLAGRSLGAPVCLDPEGAFSKKYNVATLPGLLVLKDGQAVHRGKLSDDSDRAIAAALQ
jgi:thiol-disulfide isomerase/thioredoxin